MTTRKILGFALVLIMALGPVFAPAAQAGDGSVWNPATWFSSPPETQTKEQAFKEAEQARKEAEAARQRAEEARRAAEKAEYEAKLAESKLKTYQDTGKQIVAVPVKTTEKAAQPTDAATGNRADTDQASAWNPMGWFKSGEKDEPVAAVATEDPAPAKPERIIDPYTGARIQTEKGDVVMELYPREAPVTVENFVTLVKSGFYNQGNMKFHRVVPGFVVQTGDPTGTGAGGSRDRIPLEAKNELSHDAAGVVAMARGMAPDSATSQFYITLSPQERLDGKYAIFGRVISGIDILPQIERNDRVYAIELVDLRTVSRDVPEEKPFWKLF